MKLEQIVDNQNRLEAMINEQKDKISEILSKLENKVEIDSTSAKDKGKQTRANKFYQVNICFIISFVYVVFILIINFMHNRKQSESYHMSYFMNINKCQMKNSKNVLK